MIFFKELQFPRYISMFTLSLVKQKFFLKIVLQQNSISNIIPDWKKSFL